MSEAILKEAKKVVLSGKRTAKILPGRRPFFNYRDLGVTEGTEGKMRVQITTATSAMPQPTGWHYHTCETQFVYMLKGWADLEFEDGRAVRLEAGDSVMIPGGARHQEVRSSDDFELLEVSVPADMGTVPCDPPESFRG